MVRSARNSGPAARGSCREAKRSGAGAWYGGGRRYRPRPVFACSASMRREASALLSLGSKASPASSHSVFR